jgi:ankyrin repeat protein
MIRYNMYILQIISYYQCFMGVVVMNKNILLGSIFILFLSYVPAADAMLSKFQRQSDEETLEQKRMNDYFLESCKNGKLSLVEHFIEKGADKNTTCERLGLSGRHYAASYGHLDVLKYLLKNDDYKEDYNDDITPIDCAVKHDRSGVVQWYIEEKQVDIHIKNDKGMMLHHWAGYSGAQKVLQVLIKKGADLSLRTDEGKDAFAFAYERGHIDCAKILLPYTDINRIINSEDKTTALFHAVQKGNLELVKFLMHNGADPEARTSTGFRPIELAEYAKDTPIIDYLKKWDLSKQSARELIVAEDEERAKRNAAKCSVPLKPLNGSKEFTLLTGNSVSRDKEHKSHEPLIKAPIKRISLNDFVCVREDNLGFKKSSIFLFPYDKTNYLQSGTYYFNPNQPKELVEVPQELDTIGSQLTSNHLANADYSEHVKIKMGLATDLFHNFSSSIEKKYGDSACTKVIDFKLYPEKKQYWEQQLGTATPINNRWFELHCQIPAQIRPVGYSLEKAKKNGPTGNIKYIVLAEGLSDHHEKTIVHRCFELDK